MVSETRHFAHDEIRAAAKWWREKAEGRVHHDVGDTSLNLWVNTFSALDETPPPTAEQLSRFEDALVQVLETAFTLRYEQDVKQGSRPFWDALDPNWAMAVEPRVIGNDYDIHPALKGAAAMAEMPIGMGTFPIKTVLWLAPGSVKVRCGYAADARVIFSASEDK